MEVNSAINFSEDKLLKVMESLVLLESIDLYGSECNSLINDISSYIDQSIITPDVKVKLIDYYTDVADMSGTYAYKEGFKEGIRLLRTLLIV